MAYEEERIRELEQQEKNERIQQELDLAITRIENEQIQRALDAAIKGLDQEIFDQDGLTEEQIIDEQEVQQSSSIDEERILDESVSEEYMEKGSSEHDHNSTIEYQISQHLITDEEVFSQDLFTEKNSEQQIEIEETFPTKAKQEYENQHLTGDDEVGVRTQSSLELTEPKGVGTDSKQPNVEQLIKKELLPEKDHQSYQGQITACDSEVGKASRCVLQLEGQMKDEHHKKRMVPNKQDGKDIKRKQILIEARKTAETLNNVSFVQFLKCNNGIEVLQEHERRKKDNIPQNKRKKENFIHLLNNKTLEKQITNEANLQKYQRKKHSKSKHQYADIENRDIYFRKNLIQNARVQGVRKKQYIVENYRSEISSERSVKSRMQKKTQQTLSRPPHRFHFGGRYNNIGYTGSILRSKSVRHLLSVSERYKDRKMGSIFYQKEKNEEYGLTLGTIRSHNAIKEDNTILKKIVRNNPDLHELINLMYDMGVERPPQIFLDIVTNKGITKTLVLRSGEVTELINVMGPLYKRVLDSGEQVLRSSSFKNVSSFKNAWNNHYNAGGVATNSMKKLYNLVIRKGIYFRRIYQADGRSYITDNLETIDFFESELNISGVRYNLIPFIKMILPHEVSSIQTKPLVRRFKYHPDYLPTAFWSKFMKKNNQLSRTLLKTYERDPLYINSQPEWIYVMNSNLHFKGGYDRTSFTNSGQLNKKLINFFFEELGSLGARSPCGGRTPLAIRILRSHLEEFDIKKNLPYKYYIPKYDLEEVSQISCAYLFKRIDKISPGNMNKINPFIRFLYKKRRSIITQDPFPIESTKIKIAIYNLDEVLAKTATALNKRLETRFPRAFQQTNSVEGLAKLIEDKYHHLYLGKLEYLERLNNFKYVKDRTEIYLTEFDVDTLNQIGIDIDNFKYEREFSKWMKEKLREEGFREVLRNNNLKLGQFMEIKIVGEGNYKATKTKSYPSLPDLICTTTEDSLSTNKPEKWQIKRGYCPNIQSGRIIWDYMKLLHSTNDRCRSFYLEFLFASDIEEILKNVGGYDLHLKKLIKGGDGGVMFIGYSLGQGGMDYVGEVVAAVKNDPNIKGLNPIVYSKKIFKRLKNSQNALGGTPVIINEDGVLNILERFNLINDLPNDSRIAGRLVQKRVISHIIAELIMKAHSCSNHSKLNSIF